MIPFTLTNDSITLIIDGGPVLIRADQQPTLFAQVRTGILASDDDGIRAALANPLSAIATWLRDNDHIVGAVITFDGSTLSYKGEALPRDLNARAVAMAVAGESPLPLLRFFGRLQQNPSSRSVEQLYPFLSHRGIPIDQDGSFLAYKGVRDDLKDQHSGTVDNTPGTTHELPRNKISDDPNTPCHFGFHVGALEYARGFSRRVVVCRVAPEDVVCIPYDESQQKMRVCKYTVEGFLASDQPMSSTTVTADDLPDPEVDAEAETEECDECEGMGVVDKPTQLDPTDEQVKAVYIGLAKTTAALQEWSDKAVAADMTAGAGRRNYRSPASTRGMAAKTSRELLDCTIDQLRAYAKKLRIIGASKLPGGKTALVKKISRIRRK